MSVAERIRRVMEAAGLTIEDFATQLSEKPQRIKDVFRGKQRAPEDLLIKLVEIFHADANYLLTGVSAAAKPENDKINQNVAPYGLKPDEAALLDNYRHSPPEAQAALRATSAALAQSAEGKPTRKGSR